MSVSPPHRGSHRVVGLAFRTCDVKVYVPHFCDPTDHGMCMSENAACFQGAVKQAHAATQKVQAMNTQLLGIASHSRQQEAAAPQDGETSQWVRSHLAQVSQQVNSTLESMHEMASHLNRLDNDSVVSRDEIKALRTNSNEIAQKSQVSFIPRNAHEQTHCLI
jgi:septal ring factor EnvC (AmiA/AmiB activator)